MGFALSTSWNAFRHAKGDNLLFEIEGLGFREVELSFNLTASLVTEIAEAAERSKIRLISLHNYCPIPDELEREVALPDCYSMASPDSKERHLAVQYTKRTIDTAKALGAKAVVLHCGRLDIEDRTRELIKLFDEKKKDSPEYGNLKKRAIEERAAARSTYLENSLLSLEELNQYARAQNILLGIENRFYYREIPSYEEIGTILNQFKKSNIFYWHDTGHAQLMQNLGFGKHKDYLDSYADRLIGIHLHDIAGCQDHLAPSQGEIDFAQFKPYLKQDTIKVIEAHSTAKDTDLIQSKKFLETIL